jgi:EpsI family protein
MGLGALAAMGARPTVFIADAKPKVELESIFPKEFGGWKVDNSIVPIQPPPDLQKILESTYDSTLARTYRNSAGERIMLSVAYGRNQHEGMNTHRPEICYPGQGFPIVANSSNNEYFELLDRRFTVTKLIAATKSRHEPITYWLIVGDKVTTYGFKHKLVALQYGLRGTIPDGMLIRLSSIDPSAPNAFSVQKRFVAEMLASMPESSRQIVLGRGS